MSDKVIAERLQPSLLDRLTDHRPEERTESREGRVIDMRRLREIVLRDLTWLFNTTNFESVEDLSRFPRASRSTINYGVPDIAGVGSTRSKAFELQKALREAVEAFEPRVIPGTLEITVANKDETDQPVIILDIRGELWAHPLPIELYMRTKVDIASGDVSVENQR